MVITEISNKIKFVIMHQIKIVWTNKTNEQNHYQENGIPVLKQLYEKCSKENAESFLRKTEQIRFITRSRSSLLSNSVGVVYKKISKCFGF